MTTSIRGSLKQRGKDFTLGGGGELGADAGTGLRSDPARSRMDQDGRCVTFQYTTLWKTGSSTITGRILGAKRAVSLPTENCDSGSGERTCFNGTWEGNFIFRTLDRCTDGCEALLTGKSPTVSCGNPGFGADVVCSEVLEDVSVSLDQFGRMSGTLRYAREGWYGSSSGGTSHYNFAVTGELWNLVRVK